MEDSIIKEGWVYKQTGFFKTLGKNWMVLYPQALFIYKSSEDSAFTQRILMREIVSIEKLESKREIHQMKISLKDKEQLFFSYDLAAIDLWVSALQELKKPSVSHIEKEDSVQSHLINHFARLKRALTERQAELLEENELLFQQQKEITEEHLEFLQDSEGEITQLIQAHKNESSAFHRSRSALPREVPSLLLDLPVSVSLHHNWLREFIANYTSVDFINPNEHIAHRSQTTRALKWRYNGEKADAISFSVSQDVLLTGIGLCRPYKPGKAIQIKRFVLILGKSTDSKIVYVHKKKNEIEFSPGLSVQELPLESPIILKRNLVYSAVFVVEGESSYKCVDCVDRFVADCVVWEFFSTDFNGVFISNRSDVACGPIANFQFEKLNN